MIFDPDEDVDSYDDWAQRIETFILQNPGAGNVYIADSLRIPLEAVREIVVGLAAEGLIER